MHLSRKQRYDMSILHRGTGLLEASRFLNAHTKGAQIRVPKRQIQNVSM
jgi:hypothetical protein